VTGRRAAFLATALWIAIAWLAFAGHRDLVHPDEGRYAEIPREMVETGDWLTPRLNGLKYFEKPPLQYWMTAAAFRLFGESNATARTAPIVLGLLTLGWVFLLGRRLYDTAIGACAAIVLASSLMWVGMGHILTLDMSLSAFLFLAVGSMAWAQTHRGDPARVRRWMLLAWAALGAATMSKGPVALVLAGGTVAVYSVWQRDFAIWRHLHLGAGLVVLLAVAAPWFVAAGLENPGFTTFFFVHENFARYTSDVHHRVQPWWTYVPIVLVGTLPWTVSACLALVRPGFAWRAGSGGFDASRMLWVWIGFTVLFFSASHSKLAPYVLPIFPALALLSARHVLARTGVRWAAASAILVGVVLAFVLMFPERIAASDVPPSLLAGYLPFIVAACGIFLVAGVAALVPRWSDRARVVVLGCATLAASQILVLGFQSLSRIYSSHELASAIETNCDRSVPVYVIDRYDQPLTFYLRRTVELVSVQGELAFGIADSPETEIADVEPFWELWRGPEQRVAVMRRSMYQSMVAAGVPARVVYEDPRRVAVARF
jgi:4-amino-4-deoxy-L-arabinose transferase-like glycosyltransferase